MTSTPSSGPAVPPIVRAAWVARPPEEAFAVFTEEIGAWWPLPTHGVFGDRSGGVVFRDGRLIELAKDGSTATWGEVDIWEPPSRLVIAWHPGRDERDCSKVEVIFEAQDGGTRVVIEHRGWQHFGPEAMDRRRGYVGPNAWGYVLDHFADGAEVKADTADLTDLAAAYAEFFSVAESGDFAPAPRGEWSAEEVIAHVALNDLGMLAVCQALVHGETTKFDNDACQDPQALQSWIDVGASLPSLVERGRTSAHQLMAAIARLDAPHRAVEVHCRLHDHGEVMVDAHMPWERIAITVQTERHLPAHTQQLRDLCI